MSKIINILTKQQTIITPNYSETTEPDIVLSTAMSKLSSVIVIGINKETNKLHIASSSDDVSELNLLIDLAKERLFALFHKENDL